MTSDLALPTIDAPFAHDLAVTPQPRDGSVAVALPFEDRNTMFGLIHGGALASLVPIATFAAVRAGVPGAELCTVSLHMEYIRAARKPVVIEARSVRRVRELEFFDARITDTEGNAIACASSVVSQDGAPAAADDGPARDPLDRASPELAAAIQGAIAASPYLSRRGVRLAGSARGVVELALSTAPINLDERGRVHEGVAMTLIDAAGATCPYTLGAEAGTGGATIALHVQILGPLPAAELVARAAIRARNARLSWVDVTVRSAATGALHALGTVVYRFNQGTVT